MPQKRKTVYPFLTRVSFWADIMYDKKTIGSPDHGTDHRFRSPAGRKLVFAAKEQHPKAIHRTSV